MLASSRYEDSLGSLPNSLPSLVPSAHQFVSSFAPSTSVLSLSSRRDGEGDRDRHHEPSSSYSFPSSPSSPCSPEARVARVLDVFPCALPPRPRVGGGSAGAVFSVTVEGAEGAAAAATAAAANVGDSVAAAGQATGVPKAKGEETTGGASRGGPHVSSSNDPDVTQIAFKSATAATAADGHAPPPTCNQTSTGPGANLRGRGLADSTAALTSPSDKQPASSPKPSPTKQGSLSIRSVHTVLPLPPLLGSPLAATATTATTAATTSTRQQQLEPRVVLDRVIDDIQVITRADDRLVVGPLARLIPRGTQVRPEHPQVVDVMRLSVAAVLPGSPTLTSLLAPKHTHTHTHMKKTSTLAKASKNSNEAVNEATTGTVDTVASMAGGYVCGSEIANARVSAAAPAPAELPPWMEPGSMSEMDHNRSSKMLAWKDRKLLLLHGPPDGWSRAKVVHSVKRQEGVRQRVECFSLEQQIVHLRNDPQAVQFVSAAALHKSVVAGKPKSFHEFAEKLQGLAAVQNKERVSTYTKKLARKVKVEAESPAD